MEATAKCDFQATADNELGFSRGDTLKLMSVVEDENSWCRAEFGGKEGLIPCNYINIRPHPWFMSNSREEAEEMLLKKNGRNEFIQIDGAHMVRPSGSSPGDFTLSVKFGQTVQHFKILRDSYGKYFLWIVKFNSINEVLDYHRTSSVSRKQTIYLKDMILNPVIANYDYRPGEAAELELCKGDIISVTDKTDPNWWHGEIIRNNEKISGMFPANYVSDYNG